MPRRDSGLRDLAEDSFLLTEDKQEALEDKSLKVKKRCVCCKRLYAVRDLRKLLTDFKEQDEVDKKLTKLTTGRSLVYKTVERGDLKELKKYHERHDFTKRPTMADYRRIYKVKVRPPDLKKIAAKKYATAPNEKKYAAIGTMSNTVLEDLKKKASMRKDSLGSLSEADLTNKILRSFEIKPECPRDAFKDATSPAMVKSTLTGKIMSFFNATPIGAAIVDSGTKLHSTASSTFNLLDKGSYNILDMGPIKSIRSSIFGKNSTEASKTISTGKTSSVDADPSLFTFEKQDKTNVSSRSSIRCHKQSSKAIVRNQPNSKATVHNHQSPKAIGKNTASRSPQVGSPSRSNSGDIFKSATSLYRGASMKSAISELSFESIDTVRQKVVNRFKRNWVTVSKQCETWLVHNRKYVFSSKDRKTEGRWFVLLYTNSNESEEFNSFSALYIKQTFRMYQVPYKEKDIAENKDNEDELKTKLGKNAIIETPMVFLQGSKLGNSQVIYYLHSRKKMYSAFKRYMIHSKSKYDDWYYKDLFLYQNEERHINAPLNNYPSLEAVSQGVKAKLDASGKANIQNYKEYVKLSKLKWRDVASRPYTDVDWYKFALLQAHIRDLFSMMDRIFWTVFFPEKKEIYSKLSKQKMASEIKKRNEKGRKSIALKRIPLKSNTTK